MNAIHPITVSGLRKSLSGPSRLLPFFLILILLATSAAGCNSGDKRKAEARAEWNAARAKVLLGLATDQFANGNLNASRKTCNDALQLSDRIPGLYILKAKLDIDQGNLLQARDALDAALTLQPEAAEPNYLKGVVAERWQEPQKALEHYQVACEAEPGELAYLFAAAEMLVELDRADEAAEMLEARLIYFESSAELRDMLAQIRMEQGKFSQAADLFRQAGILAPTELAYREREALAVLQSGKAARAVELLTRLVNDPANADRLSLQLGLGEAQLQAGNASAARATFQRATRKEERNVAAWLGLAKASLHSGETARAELAISRVAGLNPTARQSADAALLHGYLRLQQGKVSDAARHFAQAGRLDPQDPLAPVMYGLCLDRLGRTADAAGYWGRALELDPEDELARELLEKTVATEIGSITD